MYDISEKYNEIASQLIKTIPELDYINETGVSVVCLSCDEEKKKNHKIQYADCRKVQDIYKCFCPFDFIITVYEPNCLDFDDRQINILLEHELRHIGVNNEGEEPRYYTVPHDVEEFNTIIEKYGLYWDKKE